MRYLRVANARSRWTEALEGQASFSSPQGINSLREAARLFSQAGSPAKRAEALYWLALSEQEAKNFASALAAIEEARSTYTGEAFTMLSGQTC